MGDFQLTPPRPDQQPQPQNVERSEWIRRYADRVMRLAGFGAEAATSIAEIGAEQADEDGDDAWTDPEGAADEEMSYWTDDEGGAA